MCCLLYPMVLQNDVYFAPTIKIYVYLIPYPNSVFTLVYEILLTLFQPTKSVYLVPYLVNFYLIPTPHVYLVNASRSNRLKGP